MASLPLQANPVIDDHVIGLVAVVVLAATLAGDTWGLGKRWAQSSVLLCDRACPAALSR